MWERRLHGLHVLLLAYHILVALVEIGLLSRCHVIGALQVHLVMELVLVGIGYCSIAILVKLL